MLIAVSIVPIAFGMMTKPIPDVAHGRPAGGSRRHLRRHRPDGPVRRPGLRLWAPILAASRIGTGVAAWFGMVEPGPVLAARWIGLPAQGHPGLDLYLRRRLLGPAAGLRPGDRRGRHRDLRRRCGGAEGLQPRRTERSTSARSKVRSTPTGSATRSPASPGTVPNTVYSTSVAVVEITGIASRSVGLWGGAFLIVLAFMPKVAAALAAIPSPVAGAYIFVLLILLFSHGVRLITEEGVSFAEGFAVCTSFWIGVAVQNKLVFHESLPLWFKTIFSNGTTAGGVAAILLMLLLRLGGGHRRSLRLRLDDPEAPGRLEELIRGTGKAGGWEPMSTARLVLVGEAALACLRERMSPADHARPVTATLQRRGATAELELACCPLRHNVGDPLVQPGATRPEHLDTLTGLAESLEHRQFQGGDYLLVKVPVAGFVKLEPRQSSAEGGVGQD